MRWRHRILTRLKAHIGADAESGLVHTVRGTSGHVSDIAEANTLLHGEESLAFGDAGYQGIEKRPDAKADVTWHVAMRPGKRRALDKDNEADAMIDQAEKLKAGVRAKVEHPFRVIKRQFGFVKVRYRGGYSGRPWLEEEHGAALHTVCAVQPVDGARQIDGGRGMSAPESAAIALQREKKAQEGRKNDGNFGALP